MVLEFMPLKPDAALPGDLCEALRKVGWCHLPQIPRVFRPVPLLTPCPAPVVALPIAPEQGPGPGTAIALASQASDSCRPGYPPAEPQCSQENITVPEQCGGESQSHETETTQRSSDGA